MPYLVKQRAFHDGNFCERKSLWRFKRNLAKLLFRCVSCCRATGAVMLYAITKLIVFAKPAAARCS